MSFDYLFLAGAAFRINETALVVFSSESNPKTAEYFLPTT